MGSVKADSIWEAVRDELWVVGGYDRNDWLMVDMTNAVVARLTDEGWLL